MKAVLLAIGLAVLPATVSAADKPFTETARGEEAWWLRTRYHPFGKDARGIPLARIRSSWCKANEFRKDLFPRELAASFEGHESLFAADGFFDGSRVKQTALVGVYETCAGERGAFFLIIGHPEGKRPEVRFLREIKGDNGFAALGVAKDGTITVYYCLECDFGSQFKWDRAKKRFVKLPPSGDSD